MNWQPNFVRSVYQLAVYEPEKHDLDVVLMIKHDDVLVYWGKDFVDLLMDYGTFPINHSINSVAKDLQKAMQDQDLQPHDLAERLGEGDHSATIHAIYDIYLFGLNPKSMVDVRKICKTLGVDPRWVGTQPRV